jgi:hypothetical protein
MVRAAETAAANVFEINSLAFLSRRAAGRGIRSKDGDYPSSLLLPAAA